MATAGVGAAAAAAEAAEASEGSAARLPVSPDEAATRIQGRFRKRAAQAEAERRRRAGGGAVRVMVRVRPFDARERGIAAAAGEELRCVVEFDGRNCTVLDHQNDFQPHQAYQAFVFDECLWSMPEDDMNPLSPNGFADQELVYQLGGKDALSNAWEGYNTCIFAYGQSGAGKSYSMLGAPDSPGITPRLIADLFAYIAKQREDAPKTVYTVNATFFEIYMEKVKDLFVTKLNRSLNTNRSVSQRSGDSLRQKSADSLRQPSFTDDYSPVKIRQHPLYGIQVQGLETKCVSSEEECSQAMAYGVKHRALAETRLNATSSRSHAIFQIHINVNDVSTKTKTQATINLVDLAGSERLNKSGATGQTKDEGMAINLSLSTLRKVMDALVEQSKGRKVLPPYRESMLTWVLKESLGGNSKTVMITAISPHYDNLEDTTSTLRYGLKARAIVNRCVRQETSGNAQIRDLQCKIAELEERLAAGASGGGCLSLEEQQDIAERLDLHRQAEEEVKGEMQAVEARAQELEWELQNMKRLRFARAFRIAFVRHTEKKSLNAEINQLKNQNTELAKHIAFQEGRGSQDNVPGKTPGWGKPGKYLVRHMGTEVHANVDRGERICRLQTGVEVDVTEVVRREDMRRVRARIADPQGWVSLEDLGNGYMWFEEKPASTEKTQAAIGHGKVPNSSIARSTCAPKTVTRTPPRTPSAQCHDDGGSIAKDHHFGGCWGGAKLDIELVVLFLASLVVVIEAGRICKGGNRWTTWALVCSVVSLSLTLFLLVNTRMTNKTARHRRYLKCGALFLSLWWLVGTWCMTFNEPFQKMGNGFFGAWVAVYSAWFLTMEAWDVGKISEVSDLAWSPKLLAGATLGSFTVLAQSIADCKEEGTCPQDHVLPVGCSGVGFTIGLFSMILVAVDDLDEKWLRWIAVVLTCLWGAGVGVVTFDAPYAEPGNAYFGSWAAFSCSTLLMCVFFGFTSSVPPARMQRGHAHSPSHAPRSRGIDAAPERRRTRITEPVPEAAGGDMDPQNPASNAVGSSAPAVASERRTSGEYGLMQADDGDGEGSPYAFSTRNPTAHRPYGVADTDQSTDDLPSLAEISFNKHCVPPGSGCNPNDV